MKVENIIPGSVPILVKIKRHKSFTCPAESDTKQSSIDNCENGSSDVYQVNNHINYSCIVKPVNILDHGAFDTRYDENLCCESFWKKLRDMNSTPFCMHLNEQADALFHTRYCFKYKLRVDGQCYDVEIYTVPDEAIELDAIICRPLFQTKVELKVNPQSVTIVHADIM